MLRRFISLGLSVGLLSSLGLTSALAADNSAAQQAAWKSQDLSFPYMGFTTLYSCTGIEDRMEQFLKQLGARSDVRVSALNCAGDQVSKSLSTRIRVSVPSASGGEGEKFEVKPSTVTLRANPQGNSGPGNCELLEQLRDRVLPELGLKVVGDDLHCTPGQATGAAGTLQVAALLPQKGAEKAK